MLNRDEDILKAAEDWQKAGRGVALATVVETWGSAPRPVGSSLVINDDGTFLGSVSGGCVEGAVVTEALDVIESGKPKMLEFGVADETAWNVGLSCGGTIRVFRREGRQAVKLETLSSERRARRAAAGDRRHRYRQRRAAAGQGRKDIAADPLRAAAGKALRMGKSGMIEAGGKKAVSHRLRADRAKLVIVGAVHISQALAPMARSLDYDVTVVDPRTAFASPERFPTCR
jgi:xanthine dehydrogenase accessory factor